MLAECRPYLHYRGCTRLVFSLSGAAFGCALEEGKMRGREEIDGLGGRY
jgi:hypothetical protein